jgi:hypothetical protein
MFLKDKMGLGGHGCTRAAQPSNVERVADRSGCLGALFRRAVDGSNAPDLLGKHLEFVWIGLHQHPLNEDMEHLQLFRCQRLFWYVRDHS